MSRDESESATHHVDEERMKEAVANTEVIVDAAEAFVDAAIAETARESGRTPEEQERRMGDHFAYQAAEMNPDQMQLDDYEISGETVEVRP